MDKFSLRKSKKVRHMSGLQKCRHKFSLHLSQKVHINHVCIRGLMENIGRLESKVYMYWLYMSHMGRCRNGSH